MNESEMNGSMDIRPNFREITPLSLSERVSSALKDAFFSGQLKPGDAIVERDIARQMNVGTPVVREALISLQGQGFVRRVTNTGTYVTKFSAEEVFQLYTLRVELELLALQWARTRVTEIEIRELRALADLMVQAGEAGNSKEFLERDYAFHQHCWALSGNAYLTETLERLMAPLFVFVVLASGVPLTGSMGRDHYPLADALENLEEPEFTTAVRKALTVFAARWLGIFRVEPLVPPEAELQQPDSAT